MIKCLDYIVLTVANMDRSLAFYTDVLGLPPLPSEQGDGVQLEQGKIVFQRVGEEMRHHALEGAAHFSLLSDLSSEQLADHFNALQVWVLEGPVELSDGVFFTLNDPDNNLIRIRCLPE